MFTRKLALAALALGGLGFGQAAQAQGALNVYCSVQNEWCQAIVTNFQRDTGVRVNMTQRGSGESLAAKPDIGARILRLSPDGCQALARATLRHIHPNAGIALEIGDNRLTPFILDRAIDI